MLTFSSSNTLFSSLSQKKVEVIPLFSPGLFRAIQGLGHTHALLPVYSAL